MCTWYGDRYEFRDGAPTADSVLLLLGELAMMLYDAMDFERRRFTSGALDFRQVVVALWW